MWLRAHADNDGNDMADGKAREGALGTPHIPIIFQTAPMKYFKEIIKDHTNAQINEQWSELPGCKQTKAFFPRQDKQFSKHLLNLSRSELALMIASITGHDELRYFRSKHIPNTDPTCSLCGEEDETFLHLATKCPDVAVRRREVLGTSIVPHHMGNYPWSLDKLERLLKTPKIRKLVLGEKGLT